jgi:hypothetical protein
MALRKKKDFSAIEPPAIIARSNAISGAMAGSSLRNVASELEPSAAAANSTDINVCELTKSIEIQIPSPTSVTSAPKAAISHKEVLGGCQRLLTSPATPKKKVAQQPIAQPPLLYVGIILQRQQSDKHASFSWGISMIKERAHVHVVGVNPSSSIVSFCRVSNIAPDNTTVYAVPSKLKLPESNYQSNFVQSFPPSWKLPSSTNSPSILSPSLQLGDAIVSINGVPISSFDNIAAVASYIRMHCKSQLIIVAIRHHLVWRAAWNEMTKKTKIFPHNGGNATNTIVVAKTTEMKQQQQLIQQKQKENALKDQKERVTRAIREGWNTVQRINYAQAVKRQLVQNAANYTTTYNSNASKKPRLDQHYNYSTMWDRMHALADTRTLTNPAFKDQNGNCILYADNQEVDPEDGRRFRQFASNDVKVSFCDWLKVRKVSWRGGRKNVHDINGAALDLYDDEDVTTFVPHDFWIASGFESIDEWLLASKAQWRRNYSWHKNKKMKMQEETEKQVHFPSAELITACGSNEEALVQFNDWLGVRKQQWRIGRRKRQLERADSSFEEACGAAAQDATSKPSGNSAEDRASLSPAKSRRTLARLSSSNDTMIIDELLEEQQRQEKEHQIDHAPLDISWIFDSSVGAPDDVIVLLMRFLNPSDHGTLLCLSWTSNYMFKKRDAVWQSLCPKRWILPRRPRKSW